MILQFNFQQHLVLLENQPEYVVDGSDGRRDFRHHHRLGDDQFLATSAHSVRVIPMADHGNSASCLVIAGGGPTVIHEHSAVVNGDRLLMAVGPFVVSLQLPCLELKWSTRTDDATCFGIYHSKENKCYLSHGELEVARLSYDGSIVWANGGADIFTNGFSVNLHFAEAVDFNGRRYAWSIASGESVDTQLPSLPK